jgi:hypothetical protein
MVTKGKDLGVLKQPDSEKNIGLKRSNLSNTKLNAKSKSEAQVGIL